MICFRISGKKKSSLSRWGMDGVGEWGVMASIEEPGRCLLHSSSSSGGGEWGGGVGLTLHLPRDQRDGGNAENDDYKFENGFILTESHRRLFWLLEWCILRVAKYSQSDTRYVHRDYDYWPQNMCCGATSIKQICCARISLHVWIWLSTTTTDGVTSPPLPSSSSHTGTTSGKCPKKLPSNTTRRHH